MHVAPQLFNRLMSSTEAERRVRKMATMIASPTTTSAAATTITKNASTWPVRSPWIRANVTSMRFVALSMSSTPMNTMIAFLRSRTVVAPIEKRIAERTR